MSRYTKMAAGLGALALLTGCGGDGGSGSDDGSDFADGSAKEITSAASEDMKSLDSLRMAGEVTTDGDKVTIDLSLNTDGDCSGSVGVMGGTAEIRKVGDQSWFKPDEAFWRAAAGAQADQVLSVVGDNWVVLPPEESDFTSFCDLDSLLDELEDGPDDSATKGDTESVDGQDAVIIEAETDEGDPVKAWVAVDGEHYILKMEVSAGEEPGTITFSDFDEDFQIEAPPEDETIDLNNAM